MKNALLAVFALASFVLAGCGGSGPCDTLSAKCSACANATAKAACQSAVTTYKQANQILGGSGDTACTEVLNAKSFDADSSACKM